MTPDDRGHERLRRGGEIAAVLGGRRQRAGRLLVVHAARRTPDGVGNARVAVVASRRVGGAVQRNRAKRLLREAARRLPLRSDVDLVLVARPPCAVAHLDTVVEEVGELARALDVLAATDASVGAQA